MSKYQVTMKVEGKPDHTVVVEADNEGKARTRAMMVYPHKLRGETVAFVVEPLQ